MGLPRITYDPGAGQQILDFPEQLSAIEGAGRLSKRLMNEGQSGVVGIQFEHFREELEPVIEMMPRASQWASLYLYERFVGGFEPFFGHAGKGGLFAFARDSDDMAESTASVALSAGATNIRVVSSAAFQVGQRYAMDSIGDGWQREHFTVLTKDVTSPPSLQIAAPGLIFSYLAGDLVRSIGYFSKCSAVGSPWPFEEIPPNAFRFRFRLRTVRDSVVV